MELWFRDKTAFESGKGAGQTTPRPAAGCETFQLPPSYPTSIKLLLSFWDVSRRIKVAEKL